MDVAIELKREMSVLEDEPLKLLVDPMKVVADEPLKLITDECFDFDLQLSPKSTEEDSCEQDDEDIFFGPMGHSEKCIAAFVEEEAEIKNVRPLSPLTAKEHAEIFKEAHTIAYLLQKTAAEEGKKETSLAGSETVTIKRTESRVSPENFSLGAVKRKLEEFNVSDDSCDSDSLKKSRFEVPALKLPEVCDTEESSETSAANRTFDAESEAATAPDIEDSSRRTLRIPPVKRRSSSASRDGSSPKRRTSGIKRSGTFTQSDKPEVSDIKRSNTFTQKDKPEISNIKRSGTFTQSDKTPEGSNIKRSATFTQNDKSEGNSFLQPPKKRFALTSPEDDSKAISRISLEETRQNIENKRSEEAAVKETSSLPKPRTLARPGSALPAPKSMLRPPGSGIAAPKVSGLKQPATSNVSKLKAPGVVKSGLQAPSQIQKPMSKLQLMKPNAVSMQRKAVQSQAKSSGPMKATASLQSMGAVPSKLKTTTALRPVKAVKAVGDSLNTSTVKSVKPDLPRTPPTRHSSDSSTASTGTPVTRSGKRLSCLPTPKRTSTYRSSASSVSSLDSHASPAVVQSRRPLVQHTPVGGKENKTALSAWSPVRRPKPISLEDELIQCTKRTVPRHNSTHF